MSGSTKMLIVLAVFASMLCALPCAAVTWDFKTDIATALNPSGMLIPPTDWTYGWANNASPFTGYQFQQFYGLGVDRACVFYSAPPPISLAKVWVFWQPSMSNRETPAIYYNNTTGTVSNQDVVGYAKASHDTLIFPGHSSTKSKTIVRWTAPGTGSYNVSATFTRYTDRALDNDVHVIKNATTELGGATVAVGSDVYTYPATDLSLTAGDTLDFVIGYGTTTNPEPQGCNLAATITSAGAAAAVSGTTTPGAKVTAAGGRRSTLADGSGNFTLGVVAGGNNFTVSKSGYVTQTFAVTAPSSGINLSLTTSSGTVTGTVTADGQPVYRAKVEVVGGTDFTYTAANGTYTLPLPTGSYNLRASKLRGFTDQTVSSVSVTNGSTTTQNFTISMNAGANWPAAVTNETWNKQNPNDNWSYGYAPDASPFTGYTFTLLTEMHLGRGCWWSNGDAVIYGCGGPDSWTSEGWYASPYIGQRGGTANKTIVRFTAPVPGWYTINSSWGQMWAGTVDWHVVVNGTTLLQTGSGVPGSGPTLYTPVQLPQGGTIDFCIGDNDNGVAQGDAARLYATVSYGVAAASGWVRNSSGVGIEGARVEVVGGTDVVYTDSSGNYMLPTSPGTPTIKVTKLGYETATQSVTINAGVISTLNFTLQNSGIFSGRVLAKPAPGTPIAGVTLSSSDGAYTLTTGTDGAFSSPVSSGNYKFRVYKYGYLSEVIDITMVPSGLVQPDILLTKGWDLADDFNTASNPSGVWNLAQDTGTSVIAMTHRDIGWGSATPWPYVWDGAASTVGCYGAWAWNPSWTTRPKEGVYRGVWEPWSVLTHPGYQFNIGDPAWVGRKSVARFTAPESGSFDIEVKWTARTDHDTTYTYVGHPSVDGTTSQVSIVKTDLGGTTTLLSGQLDGYVGTPSLSYTDSFGTCPVISYNNVESVMEGDVYDVIVSGDNSGWTGVEFTVSAKSAGFVTGVVTSDKPGNPAVVEALVTASKPGSDSYTVRTDATGRYMMTIPAGTYQITASRNGYSNGGGGSASDVVAVAGATVTQDLSLVFDGVWDASTDYSSVYNPVGEWSYGWSTESSNRADFTLYTQQHGVIGSEYANYKFWTAFDGAMWWGGIRKNGDSVISIFDTPWIDAEYQQTWYSEPHQLVMTPGGMDWFSVLRWTAPEQMVVNVNATWKSQWAPGYITNGSGGAKVPLEMALVKNGTVISAPVLVGFIGRGVNNFTDSYGNSAYPAYGPSESFSSPILVNAGDTIDFSYMPRLHQQYLIGIDAQMSEFSGSYAIVNNISQIKAQADGTVVFLETPMQLSVGTYHTGAGQKGCFKFQYGTALPEVSWFIQSDDRLQGIKCIVPAGGMPALDPDQKITLTGTVATQYGQKVILVGSINSYVPSEEPKPLGKGLKSQANTGTLVRAWGQITHLELNPNPVIDPISGTKDFVYEYMTLNDGGQSIKVLLHVQGEMISDYDGWVRNLSEGDYMGVTGIAYTIGGGEVVVMPRTKLDINNYTDD